MNIDWQTVAAAAAVQAAEVDNSGLYFGIDVDGDIGSHLETSPAGASAYWVPCRPDIDADGLADDLAEWADGRHPVGIVEIAARLGASRSAVDKWRQRDLGFPTPRWTVGGRPSWRWSDVAGWAAETGRD